MTWMHIALGIYMSGAALTLIPSLIDMRILASDPRIRAGMEVNPRVVVTAVTAGLIFATIAWPVYARRRSWWLRLVGRR